MKSCLYEGTVRHRRSQPKVHDFRYQVFMFYLDLDELPEVNRLVRPFSVNRFNLVSYDDRDHMDRRPGSTKEKLLRFLGRHGIDVSDGQVFLLTGCRMLGYVFNPISLYYCHGRSGTLEAVVAEVNNTFGEQYLYVLNDPLNDGASRSEERHYRARKAMHVSPFISMDAAYDFHLAPVDDTLGVRIVEHEGGNQVLDVQLWGRQVSLTTASLSRVLLRYPLMTFKTIASIHGEALRLYLKRVPLHRQPTPSIEQRAQHALLTDLRQP